MLDGRDPEVPPECRGGFFIGPTILDHVTEDMSVGRNEVFGPVLCVKRVEDFEEGLTLMNNNPFANGSVIYTQNGYYAREFAKAHRRRHGGHKRGHPGSAWHLRLHRPQAVILRRPAHHGPGRIRLLHRDQNVTSTWFSEEEEEGAKVDTWDGTISSLPQGDK